MDPIVNFVLSTVVTLLIIGFLVMIHEAGHFLAARLMGVKVEKFAIGFGPTILKKNIGETEFSLKLIMLGGYVQMLGDADASSTKKIKSLKDHPRSYLSKNMWQKLFITVAGPFVNFVFAGVAFVFYLLLVSNTVALPKIGEYSFLGADVIPNAVVLYDTFQDQSDSVTGFILKMDGQKVTSRVQLLDILEKNYDKPIELELFQPSGIVSKQVVLNGEGLKSNFDLDFFPNVRELAQDEFVGRIYFADIKEGSAIAEGEVVAGPLVDKGDSLERILVKDSKDNLVESYLMRVADVDIYNFDKLTQVLEENLGNIVEVEILNSQGESSIIKLTLPEETPEDGALLGVKDLGLVLAGFDSGMQILRYENALTGGAAHAVNSVGYNGYALLSVVGEAVGGDPEPLTENVGSVVRVGTAVGDIFSASHDGGPQVLSEFFNLVGLFSAVLAFMNLLPIPILDGGNAVIILIEGILGKPLPERLINILYTVFFVLLIIVGVAAIGLDIFRELRLG